MCDPASNSRPLYSLIITCLALTLSLGLAGCRSPYAADRGAGFGALVGAGTGAIIGEASGNSGNGALIGAGLGALTGAAVGSELDALAAQNRAEIAAQLGRQVQPGVANLQEVVALTKAGVSPQLIQNYIRTSGVAAPLTANDIIALHEQGVATEVIQTLQTPPQPNNVPQVATRTPVIVEEHYYGRPGCRPHYGYHHGIHHKNFRRGGRTSFGISFSN